MRSFYLEFKFNIGGDTMRHVAIVLVMGFMFLIFAGAGLANETSGVVTGVDAAKGTLTLKNGSNFDGVSAGLLKGVKAGDSVKVEYKEEGGKKIVIKITLPPVGC
jgi:Cu/Ag efflux protein CusF